MAHPKTLGGTADKLFKLRSQRLEIEKKVKALKAEQAELEEHALVLLTKERANSAKGKFASISKHTVNVPAVEDWDAFYKFIKKNDAFDLLQRRVNGTAWLDRSETKLVPGTKSTKLTKLSITKA